MDDNGRKGNRHSWCSTSERMWKEGKVVRTIDSISSKHQDGNYKTKEWDRGAESSRPTRCARQSVRVFARTQGVTLRTFPKRSHAHDNVCEWMERCLLMSRIAYSKTFELRMRITWNEVMDESTLQCKVSESKRGSTLRHPRGPSPSSVRLVLFLLFTRFPSAPSLPGFQRWCAKCASHDQAMSAWSVRPHLHQDGLRRS